MDITTLAKKYEMDVLEDYVKNSEEPEWFAKILWYETFLRFTDYIVLKLTEGSLTTEDCKDELAAREIARQEIAKLNGETYESKQNAKTIDERTTILEVDGLQAVIDQECRISMLGIGIAE